MIVSFKKDKVALCKCYIKDIEINSTSVHYNNYHKFGWNNISKALSYFNEECKKSGFKMGYNSENESGVLIRQIKEKWGNFTVYETVDDDISRLELIEVYYKVLKKFPGLENYFDVFTYDEKEIKTFPSISSYRKYEKEELKKYKKENNIKKKKTYKRDKNYILYDTKKFLKKIETFSNSSSVKLDNGDTSKIRNISINDVSIKGFGKLNGKIYIKDDNLIIEREAIIIENILDPFEMQYYQNEIKSIKYIIENISKNSIYKSIIEDNFIILYNLDNEEYRMNIEISYF